MPETTTAHELEEFFAGLRAAHDDPCVLNTSASFWWQRGFATGVVDRIDRAFGYGRAVLTSDRHVQ